MQITPPAKGSFPLDHDGECKPLKVEFLDCLKEHGNEHINCKSISKRYLECRMNAGLMARDDLANVGFAREDTEKKRSSSPESKEEEGGGRDRVSHLTLLFVVFGREQRM